MDTRGERVEFLECLAGPVGIAEEFGRPHAGTAEAHLRPRPADGTPMLRVARLALLEVGQFILVVVTFGFFGGRVPTGSSS